MDSKIEHIIKNYQYFELDETQKKLIADWAENSDEFEALQSTLLATDHFVKSQEEDLNPTIKKRLDVRFAEKHDHQRLVWYNKLWLFLWPNESPFYKRPLIQFAAICLIIVSTIPFFPDFNQPQLAMNELEMEEKIESEDESNDVPEEKDLVEKENIDEVAEAEQKDNGEATKKLNDIKVEDFETNEQSILSAKEEGWKLKEEESMAGIESRSERSLDALKDVPSVTEDQEEVNFYDKSDMDTPSINQVGANRLAEKSEMPKKVETKETLDLITALY